MQYTCAVFDVIDVHSVEIEQEALWLRLLSAQVHIS